MTISAAENENFVEKSIAVIENTEDVDDDDEDDDGYDVVITISDVEDDDGDGSKVLHYPENTDDNNDNDKDVVDCGSDDEMSSKEAKIDGSDGVSFLESYKKPKLTFDDKVGDLIVLQETSFRFGSNFAKLCLCEKIKILSSNRSGVSSRVLKIRQFWQTKKIRLKSHSRRMIWSVAEFVGSERRPTKDGYQK